MTFAERITAAIAALKGKQSADAQAIVTAQSAQHAAETQLADYVAEVGDVPTIAADLPLLEQLAGITSPSA